MDRIVGSNPVQQTSLKMGHVVGTNATPAQRKPENVSFGSGEAGYLKALAKASENPGSELVYQDSEGNWQVKTLEQEKPGFSFSVSNKDREQLAFDHDALRQEGVARFTVSFIEDNHKIGPQIALDPSTPAEVLHHLATESESSYVKSLLLDNPNLPPETFNTLINSNDFTILSKLLNDKETSADVLRHVYNNLKSGLSNEDKLNLAYIAKHPNAPHDVLTALSKIDDVTIHYALPAQYR